MQLEKFRHKLESSKLDPEIRKVCLSITDTLLTLKPGDGKHLSLRFFSDRLPNDEYRSQLLSALSILCTIDDAVLSMHGYLDGETTQHHLSDAEFAELISTGKLADPESGEMIPNPLGRVRVFYSIRDERTQ
jgi:hypothetical protein